MQKLLKSVKIWQSCSQMYSATFHESWQNAGFNFSRWSVHINRVMWQILLQSNV